MYSKAILIAIIAASCGVHALEMQKVMVNWSFPVATYHALLNGNICNLEQTVLTAVKNFVEPLKQYQEAQGRATTASIASVAPLINPSQKKGEETIDGPARDKLHEALDNFMDIVAMDLNTSGKFELSDALWTAKSLPLGGLPGTFGREQVSVFLRQMESFYSTLINHPASKEDPGMLNKAVLAHQMYLKKGKELVKERCNFATIISGGVKWELFEQRYTRLIVNVVRTDVTLSDEVILYLASWLKTGDQNDGMYKSLLGKVGKTDDSATGTIGARSLFGMSSSASSTKIVSAGTTAILLASLIFYIL